MTTALQCINSLKPYTLAGFEPGIFSSVGGRDDRYATPPWQKWGLMLYVPLNMIRITICNKVWEEKSLCANTHWNNFSLQISILLSPSQKKKSLYIDHKPVELSDVDY
jgi:hypothetical protein